MIAPYEQSWNAFTSIDSLFKNASEMPTVTDFVTPKSSTTTPPYANTVITGCPVDHEPTISQPSLKCFREAMGAKNPEEENKRLDDFYQPFVDSMKQYGINTPEKQALFLGQVAHETNNLKKFKETDDYGVVTYNNEPYSLTKEPVVIEQAPDGTKKYKLKIVKRIIQERTNSFTGKHQWDVRAADKLAANADNTKIVELEEEEYKSVMGTKIEYFEYLNQGSLAKDKVDQKAYIGRGGLQLTGIDNYKDFTKENKKSRDQTGQTDQTDYALPENAKKLATEPKLIANSAGYFWKKNVADNVAPIPLVNPQMDDDHIDSTISKASSSVNRYETDSALLNSRKEKTKKIYDILKRPGCAAIPAQPIA